MTSAAQQRSRRISHEQWNGRAIEIAYAHRLAGTDSYAGYDPRTGEDLFMLGSLSNPAQTHTVRIASDGTAVCACRAAQHGLPCGHAGAALLRWEQWRDEAARRAAYDDEFDPHGTCLDTH